MYKYNIGVIPDVINACNMTSSNVHSYNTGNRSVFSRHKYMHRNFSVTHPVTQC